MNNQAIARELVRLAKSILSGKYGHTLWINPNGKVVDLGNSDMHYNWIANNFSTLFPEEEFCDKAVYEAPMKYGWVHVRNHTMGPIKNEVYITGSKAGIRKNSKILGNIVMDGYENAISKGGDHMFVFVSNSRNHRDSYMLPDDLGVLGRIVKL